MKILFIALFCCMLAPAVYTQAHYGLFEKKEWISGTDTLRYRQLLPVNYDATKQYPVILFLHGAGERGSDNEFQLLHGSSLFAQQSVRESFPAIVLFPQCPASDFWSNVNIKTDQSGKRSFDFPEDGEPRPVMKNLMSWFGDFIKQPNVKPDQVYIMGMSMGGMGTFELTRRMPNVFAAAVPICGGANPATARQIRKIPFWIFHGAADPVVPSKLSEDMIIALQQFYDAADMQFTLYPGVGHNSWDNVFKEHDLLPWLFANVKAPPPAPR